jgi:uncharacterized protein YciI
MSEDIQNIRYVVFHTPGPVWQEGVDFREQPGISDHYDHFHKFFEDEKLELGGPFLLPDLGGMMVASKDVPMEEIIAFAAQDPAVQSGVLEYEVRPWHTAMDRCAP